MLGGRLVALRAWLSFVVFNCAYGDLKEYVFDTNYFRFNPDGHGEVWMQGINGQIPAPEIRVKNGDTLRVTLINNCQTEDLTIHWHGLEMRSAQEYDGVMGVTMCPVEPGHSFVYEFPIEEVPGTYLYHEHAHLEHVAGRGFFGALIVEEPDGKAGPWDNDYCGIECDAVLGIFDYWPVSQHDVEGEKVGRIVRTPMVSSLGNGVGLLPFHNLLINGRGGFNVFGNHNPPDASYITDHTKVSDLFEIVPTQGQTWRLRLINMGAMFAIRFRIDHHRLKVVATDGADVEPLICDAITMSAGERFDVLVTFNQAPGSYWMRAETLEEGFGIHHGQLAVLRYNGTVAGVLPDKGYSISDTIKDHPSLVTLNCVDQAKPSSTCLPITALRRHTGLVFDHIGHAHDETHDFEVSLRGFAGDINTHMTRVLDLKDGGNPYGENQFEGPYTQFAPPKVPYPYINGSETHENTLVMRLSYGEVVRVVLQWQDRAAHPWHMHGHKFAVLAFGFPDYEKDCDLIYCRSKSNHWLTRDGAIQANGKFTSFGRKISEDDKIYSTRYPTLLDPDEAPLKDTLHLPAGGWAVIQFKADNPGWWFFHCHMLVHMADGMALVIEEAREMMPDRLYNTTYLHEKGFPSCSDMVTAYEEGGVGKGCQCWQNPEMKWDNWMRSSYKCTSDYLCGQELLNPLEPHQASRSTTAPRQRTEGRVWRIGAVCFWLGIVGMLFLIKAWHTRAHSKRHFEIAENLLQFATDLRRKGDGLASDLKHVASDKLKNLEEEFEVTGGQRHARELFHNKAHKERHAEYHLSLEFLACQGSRETNFAVKGRLEPGSLMMVLGAPEVTKMWIKFFGTRTAKKIRGNLILGSENVARWPRRELRHVIGYLPQTKVAARTNVYVLEILNLYMKLGCSRHVHRADTDVTNYRDRLIGLFKLQDHLSSTLGSLSREALLRVNLARELLLPRSLLVLQDPLDCLEFRHARKVMKMLKRVCTELKVTVILSSEHTVSEVGQHATHGLVAHEEFSAFGPKEELESFCSFVSRNKETVQDRPPHLDVFEHCSNLLSKSILDNIFEITTKKLNKGSSVDSRRSGTLSLDATTELRAPSDQNDGKIKFLAFVPDPEEKVSESTNGAIDPRGSETSWNGRQSGHSDGDQSRHSDNSWTVKRSGHGKSVRTKVKKFMSFLEDAVPGAHKATQPVEDVTKPPRAHRSLFVQVRILTEFELLRGFKDSITVYKLVETLGIGLVASMVWWRKGSVDTQTSLGEVVGLLFFTTALWTLPPIFQALTAMPGILALVNREYSGGLYNLHAFVLANFIASAFTLTCVWPPLWQSVAYAGAEVGPTIGAVIQMKIILSLNVLTMRTMGLVLALVVPSQQTNVVIGNIVGQFCLLTNGFYTKLPDAFLWVTHFSIPRYTLRALLKLEFAWDDVFLVNPMTGSPDFGFPTMYIPAQLTGLFQTMHDRKMDIMTSYQDSDVLQEMYSLIAITLLFQCIFYFGLLFQCRRIEGSRSTYDEDSFFCIESWKDLLGKSTISSGMNDKSAVEGALEAWAEIEEEFDTEGLAHEVFACIPKKTPTMTEI